MEGVDCEACVCQLGGRLGLSWAGTEGHPLQRGARPVGSGARELGLLKVAAWPVAHCVGLQTVGVCGTAEQLAMVVWCGDRHRCIQTAAPLLGQ